MDEILPCAKCGGTAALEAFTLNTFTRWRVRCGRCQAVGIHYHRTPVAIGLWNEANTVLTAHKAAGGAMAAAALDTARAATANLEAAAALQTADEANADLAAADLNRAAVAAVDVIRSECRFQQSRILAMRCTGAAAGVAPLDENTAEALNPCPRRADGELLQKLLAILANHVGPGADNRGEGAVETLTRIIKQRDDLLTWLKT